MARNIKHALSKLLEWRHELALRCGIPSPSELGSRCSPAASCYSPSSNSITTKLYLIPRRGRAQSMEMLPALRESSPSSKFLQIQDSIIWWTNTCPWRGGTTIL
jgi:hypothetical protein